MKNNETIRHHSLFQNKSPRVEMIIAGVPHTGPNKTSQVHNFDSSSRRKKPGKGPRFAVSEHDIVLGPPGLLFFGVLISLLAGCITMLGT